MSEKNKPHLSYSGWKKYMTCPKMYDYYYNQRLRPMGKSSALYFGVAIDEALNALLLGKADALKTFQDFFKFEDMTDCTFDDRDFDADLFNSSQIEKLSGKSFDYKAWACMRIKGRLLLEKYIEEIYPLIQEVHSVQMALPTRPGFLDAVVTLKGYGKVLIDHKTAAMPYQDDAVTKDTQLALYAQGIGIKRAGFVVLSKRINKNKTKICASCSFNGSFTRHKTCPKMVNGTRCHGTWKETVSPEGSIQVIIGDVPEINKELITESIELTEEAIKCGKFPRNLSACQKMYGKPCPYIKKCYENSDDNLEQATERKRK